MLRIQMKQNIHILIKSTEKLVLNTFKIQRLTEYLRYMEDVYKRTEECSTDRKRKVLIVFDDIIADLISNKKHSLIVTELFISGRKLNISGA